MHSHANELIHYFFSTPSPTTHSDHHFIIFSQNQVHQLLLVSCLLFSLATTFVFHWSYCHRDVHYYTSFSIFIQLSNLRFLVSGKKIALNHSIPQNFAVFILSDSLWTSLISRLCFLYAVFSTELSMSHSCHIVMSFVFL